MFIFPKPQQNCEVSAGLSHEKTLRLNSSTEKSTSVHPTCPSVEPVSLPTTQRVPCEIHPLSRKRRGGKNYKDVYIHFPFPSLLSPAKVIAWWCMVCFVTYMVNKCRCHCYPISKYEPLCTLGSMSVLVQLLWENGIGQITACLPQIFPKQHFCT